MPQKKSSINKIAFVGTYPPRKCGIATFTSDLCESIAAAFPDTQCYAIPVTDTPETYVYPDRVRFEILEQDIETYKRAVDFININKTDVISFQHEYGIYGGPAGSYILSLLRNVNVPIVTTLHTILKSPSKQHRRILKEIADFSDSVVVFTEKGRELLKSVYEIDPRKIRLIAHGIPDIPFIDPNFYKDQFGVEGKRVLLTFGLISPNKGIENVLRALPGITKRFPDVAYIILGQTHPNLLRTEGESYRLGLERLTEELGVEEHVMFYNRFVSIEELKEFIVMADIYITPYLNEEQVVSGTLAYTFGAGNAVISTPYWHAQELLTEDKGIIVPFKDPLAIEKAVLYLLENETKRNHMRKQSFLAGRAMVWSNAAEHYMEAFLDARIKQPALRRKLSIQPLEPQVRELPAINLSHISRMTDSTGIIQHATYNVPNLQQGYCTDDNARALILMVLLDVMEISPTEEIRRLQTIYLSFLQFAFDAGKRRFRNFLQYDRTWAESVGSEDSHGRSIWALGSCIGCISDKGFQQLAADIFEKALPTVADFSSPRSWAFALIGIHDYFRRFTGDREVNNMRELLGIRLVELYRKQCRPDWPWFEPKVTYCNAKLSHALILCGRWLGKKEMLDIGLASLTWLLSIQTGDRNQFRPIGADTFYEHSGPIPAFDQQPIEVYTTVSACLEAFRATNDPKWHNEAWRVFSWFLGKNDLGIPIYDPRTGGCYDGLHVDRVNLNQGAESTLAYNFSLAEMIAMRNELQSMKEPFNTN